MRKFEKGDEVVYVGERHEVRPDWYPKKGTTGTVLDNDKNGIAHVKWEKGSTSKEDEWYCTNAELRINSNNCW